MNKEILCPICNETHNIDDIKVTSIDGVTIIVKCNNAENGRVYWDRLELLKLFQTTQEEMWEDERRRYSIPCRITDWWRGRKR